jgi:DNA ligase (NAD+)
MDKEIEALASEVRKHNKLYWIDHKPEISDIQYDKLVEKLRNVAPFHPVLSELQEDSKVDSGKVKHAVPMLSLDKVFSAEEIVKWASGAGAFKGENVGLAVSYKVDGSSCSLMYENGKLLSASTRGNGQEGDDITANALVISGVPKTIASNKKIEIRGEVYMSNASFREAIAKFETTLKEGKVKEDDRPSNPRNYCAGSLKQKDSNITRERKLSFMAHNCVLHGEEFKLKTEFDVLKAMEKLGFETPLVTSIEKPENVAEIIKAIGQNRKNLPYDTDGIVFGLNNLSLHKELGSTGHHPRYRIAFKFARERGETNIVKIHWQTSRTGKVTPVMEVKPIPLGGATVTLCTLHNAKMVKEKKIAIGDKVLLEREVIPYFVEKISGSDKVDLPAQCPDCGAKLGWDETETQLICPNAGGCPSQLLDYLEHYVSRRVCNIMGVGGELIEKLVEAKLVKTPADFFKLTEDQILKSIPRQGDASAKKIVDAIAEHKEQPLNTFLQSLGIEKLGKTVSESLAENFGTLDKVLEAKQSDLTKISGIAEGIAEAVVVGLKERKDLIKEILKYVTIQKVAKVNGPLTGMSFCLTGHVEVEVGGQKYDARPDIEDLIKSKGGSIKSVSKNLNFLVAGSDAGSKLDKAKKNNVKIIDGAILTKMIK